MNTRRLLLDMALTIPVTFVVVVAVMYVYSLKAHGSGAIDWGVAFALAFVTGIAVSFTRIPAGKVQ